MAHSQGYMAQIRRKLEPDPSRPQYFLTEPGMGHRFQPATGDWAVSEPDRGRSWADAQPTYRDGGSIGSP